MPFRLRHLRGSKQGQVDELDLTVGDVVRVGRHPSNEIAFDPERDLSVSGFHAQLHADEHEQIVLEDLGSANGTLVNGLPIKGPTVLGSGDEITFGKNGPRLRFDTISRGAPTLSTHVPETLTQHDAPTLDEQPTSQEKRSVGTRTVGKRTVELMIRDATERTSRRFSGVALLLGSLLLAAVVVIIIVVTRGEEKSKEQLAQLEVTQEELARTSDRLAQTEDALLTVREEIEHERRRQGNQNLSAQVDQERALREQLANARLEVSEELRKEFARHREELVASLTSVETRITKESGPALFMLVASPQVEEAPPPGRASLDEGFCTAFAVSPDGWLATNAHCVESIFELRYAFARKGVDVAFVAKRNGESGEPWPLLLETATVHPLYTHAASPDVALVRVDLGARGPLVPVASLASSGEVLDLAPGEPIYTLGFPGKVMDPSHVMADFRGGNVARVTDFESGKNRPELQQFVWHTALITKGTSGSPIFDRSGRVVAINNGTMSAEQVLTSDGTTQEVRYVYSADGLNFGVRIDLLRELAGQMSVPLPAPAPTVEGKNEAAGAALEAAP